MPQFHMAGLEPPTEPLDTIAERYEASARFVDDGLSWLSDNAHRYPQLVELCLSFYRDSPEFTTVCEDIADGCDEL